MIKAVLDASVLYPAPLRDLFMHLAVQEVFRARWSNLIHDEWIRNVLKNRPDLTLARLERTKNLMNENAKNSLVTHFEQRIEMLSLPDPDDRHVLAAAIQTKADVIVTANLRHFPKKTLASLGIRPLHPDHFLLELLQANAQAVMVAIGVQQRSLSNPPVTVQNLLDTLEQQGLKQRVAQFRALFKF
jgi:predicted nucleic acid-binding protein